MKVADVVAGLSNVVGGPKELLAEAEEESGSASVADASAGGKTPALRIGLTIPAEAPSHRRRTNSVSGSPLSSMMTASKTGPGHLPTGRAVATSRLPSGRNGRATRFRAHVSKRGASGPP